jgi:hypothetical protein
MLADYKKGNPVVMQIMDECTEAASWFNNHSYALGKFNNEQKDVYKGKVHALITLAVTHWTAYFCVLTRMMEVSKALEVTSIKHGDEILDTVSRKDDSKRKAIQHVKNALWWDKVLMYVNEHFLGA